jgi:exopolysaccharide biosynthesis polyprenyl glycosylphosphotransferase
MSTADQRIVFDAEAAAFVAPEVHVSSRGVECFPKPAEEWRAISTGRFRRAAALASAGTDFFTAAAGMFAAEVVGLAIHGQGHIEASLRNASFASILVGLVVVLLLKGDRAYREAGSLLQIRETERAVRAPAQALLALVPFDLLLHLNSPGAAFLSALILIPLLLILEKHVFVSIVRMLNARGYGESRVAVYGAGNAGRRVLSMLFYSPRLGMRPVAVIDDGPVRPASRMFELGYRRRCSVPVRHGPVTATLLESCACDTVVIANANIASEKLAAVSRAATEARMRVVHLSNLNVHEWQLTETIDIDGVRLTAISDPVTPRHYAIAKRAADLTLSAVMLLLLAPLLLAIAVLVRLDSRGPALFVQKRVGLNGRLFDIFKFRSMHIDVPRYDLSPATSDDRRITRIGRLLRRTSLDELPQLMNVLLGDMSLVGPRPEMPFIVELYNARHRQRLQVIPGITGLWQLSADRDFQIHQNIEYDLYYIRNRTFFMDVAIVLHTLLFAMHGL